LSIESIEQCELETMELEKAEVELGASEWQDNEGT